MTLNSGHNLHVQTFMKHAMACGVERTAHRSKKQFCFEGKSSIPDEALYASYTDREKFFKILLITLRKIVKGGGIYILKSKKYINGHSSIIRYLYFVK